MEAKGPDGLTETQRGFAWASRAHILSIGGSEKDTLEQAFHKQAMKRSADRLAKHEGDPGAANRLS